MSDTGNDLNSFFQEEEKQRKQIQERIKEAIKKFFVQVVETFNKIKADYEKGGGVVYVFDESVKESKVILLIDNEEKFTYLVEVRKSPEVGCRVKAFFTDSEKDRHYYESHPEEALQWYALHNIDKERIIEIFKQTFKNRYNKNTFHSFVNLGKVLEKNEPETISKGKIQGINMIKIFISHSSQDEKMVKLITDLLMGALDIRENNIRCTSVEGFRLRVGDPASTTLKKEINGCEFLIGVLTSHSLNSMYVLFELGAGWGLDKRVIPILGPGFDYGHLPAPIKDNHAMQWKNTAAWLSLIEDISEQLHIDKRRSDRILSLINILVAYENPL